MKMEEDFINICSYGFVDIIKTMLENNNLSNDQIRKAIYGTCEMNPPNSLEVIILLEEKIGKLTYYDNYECFSYSCIGGNVNTLKYSIHNGIQSNSIFIEGTKLAIKYMRYEIIDYICSQGDVDLELKKSDRKNLMMTACMYGYVNLFDYLIKKETEIDIMCIYYAKYGGNQYIIDTILSKNPKLSKLDTVQGESKSKSDKVYETIKIMLDQIKETELDVKEDRTEEYEEFKEKYMKTKVEKKFETIELELKKLTKLDENYQYNESFICPISRCLMLDPVIVVGSGNTYDRSHIEKWFTLNDKDPNTNITVNKQIVPNILIRKQILEYLQKLINEND
jgi:hypothetical protein